MYILLYIQYISIILSMAYCVSGHGGTHLRVSNLFPAHPELRCQSHGNIDVDCLEGENECVKLMASLCHDNAKFR